MKKTIAIAVIGITLFTNSIEAKPTIHSSVNPEHVVKITNKVEGLSPFCNAILKGDIGAVKSMISLGEDVNKKSLGMTPSIFAARYNKAEILEVLIANGANIKIKCDKGMDIKKYAEAANADEALVIIEENWKNKK
ncbi:ankyrin repeat domain-containing protein [Cellulophaga sp. HaHaR_3_176]|uniref:ankyrin repeat domain-containing protein n=1 Tax=Cellulophaga sp. HaHaR_3_176 TaxID=1942464 RepID=UPI001C1F2D1F|nr:ankyrin repeat domain-containing protein [Cellulophaga sp. HaHaR_3_176]QWX84286.1 ankyrin repeat domain-containing protein [Cellulophaga sp. HaHaR_3_176]